MSEPVNADFCASSADNTTSQHDSEVNPFAQSDQEYSEALKNSVSDDLYPALNKDRETMSAVNNSLYRYNLKFKPECSYGTIYDLIKDYDFTVIGRSNNRWFSIASDDDLPTIEANFMDHCLCVEEDYKILIGDGDRSISFPGITPGVSKLAVSDDMFVEYQWYLDCLDVKSAWDYTTGSEAVLVAVIDTGIYRSHPDFSETDIRNGFDFTESVAVTKDYSGHGTLVSGVIAATMNNGIGIAGISPNVGIVPFRIESDIGEILTHDMINAIYYAADLTCKVINISLGSNYASEAMKEAVRYAYDRGCIIIASSGNNSGRLYNYPASYDGVISVGSVNENYTRSDFSTFNNRLDIMAPGEYILTTNNYGTYSYCDGTSFSSPCVSAIAALAASLDPGITPLEFEEMLKETSVDLGDAGYDMYTGYGIVNANNIMQMLTQPRISYQTHVQDVGWQAYVSNGAMSGTSAQSKRLEAIRIKLEGIGGGIEYRTHVQDIGWQDWVADNTLSGTSGESKRLEAIQIRLTGEAATSYDVYYRVHAQNVGWMGWAKNGESAGTAGYSYRLEAIEVKLVAKGGAAPGTTVNAYIDRYAINPNEKAVSYKTHVQDIGWQNYVRNGDISGTSGQSKRLEGIQIKLDNVAGGIEYSTHVQDIGWMNFVANDTMSGTSGQSKRLEAIKIRLTGEAADNYDIYYCVHAQNVGWLDWAKNGESAGTAGFSYRLEAIKIVLVPKGGAAPGSTERQFVQG